MLVNGAGELLLNLRAADASWYPDQWDLIGGHTEAEESAEECIVRETIEETGARIPEFFPFRTYRLPLDGNVTLTYHVFYARLDRPVESLIVGEGQEHRFFPAESLDGLEIAPVSAQVLRDFVASREYRAWPH